MTVRPRRFRSRLLLLVLGLLVLVQGATLLVVSTTVRKAALAGIRENLVLGVNNLDRLVADRMGEIADKTRLMVGDYALRRTLMETEDPATLASVLENFRGRMGGDTSRVRPWRIVLLSPAGEFVVETGTRLPDATRTVFTTLTTLAAESAEDRPTAHGHALIDGGLHGVVVVPVFAPYPEIAAWIGVAFPIDGAFAAEIKSTSRLELSFIARAPGPRLLASTLPPEMGRSLLDSTEFIALQAELAPASGDVREVLLEGETFVTLFRPLALVAGAPVVEAFQRSLDAELAPLRWLQSLLLGTTIAALAAGALVAMRLARHVSDPVRQLAAHTRVIARGDYATRISTGGAEEFEQLADSLNDMSAGLAERDRVRDLLDKNLSPEVAARLLRDGAALGGEEREVTVLFADLRGFTTLSETLRPVEVLETLNRYLARMSAAIEAEGGIVDKFIGDAVMAVFGAPVDQDDASDRALRAALAMRTALAELNAEFAREGQPPLAFGVGINTATVVAGNIGSPRRLNYSVIGDGVNVAARLQALTRRSEHAADILVSGATLARARSRWRTRALGSVEVKGRAGHVELFALDGPAVTDRECPSNRASE